MSTQDHSIDNMTAANLKLAPPGKLTEEEFVAWCDEDTRAEWVDGEVIMMSPASFRHNDLTGWLTGLLRLFIEHHGLGVVVGPEFQIRLAQEQSRRVPDILFVTGDRCDLLQENHLEGPPDLAIEIVSPESEARDWREKYAEYESAGVREYWVIDPMSQHVEAYTLAGEDGYRRVEEKEGVIWSTVPPGFRLQTKWLWPDTRPKVLEAARELGLLDS